MTQTLYALATKSKHLKLYVVNGGTHNDTWYVGGQNYFDQIKAFINASMKLQLPQEMKPKEKLMNDEF